MCLFKIQVEQVCKSAQKPYPNGLHGCETAEILCSWLSSLPGVSIHFELKGSVSHSNVNEELRPALSQILHKTML